MNDHLQNFYVKQAIIVLIITAIAIAGWFGWEQWILSQIDSFDTCQTAGYPIQESYPARCIMTNGKTFTQIIPDGGMACTMEARLCPDGSSVGRSGPNCEFSTCPKE